MGDFTYTPNCSFADLLCGDSVAWKCAEESGRMAFHHAIVENASVKDGYVNVIAFNRNGVGRNAIDQEQGLHKVNLISPQRPSAAVASGSVPHTEPEATAPSNTPPQEVYNRAVSMVGKKDKAFTNCESFVYWCMTGRYQPPPSCPMCKTTAHSRKFIFFWS